MLGLQLSIRRLPIVPVDLTTPRNREELAKKKLQRMDDLRHLPALQTWISADRVQVGNDILRLMVEKLAVLPRLAIHMPHAPSRRRGFKPMLVKHQKILVPETEDPLVERRRSPFHRIHSYDWSTRAPGRAV